MRPHRHAIRVYFEDTDAGGMVYHAQYLAFAERARTEAMRELGVPHAQMLDQHGRMFVVRRVNLEYLRPARLDCLLTVVTETLALGGASASLRQSFLAEEERLAVLDILLACIGRDGRPARIPTRWRAALSAEA